MGMKRMLSSLYLTLTILQITASKPFQPLQRPTSDHIEVVNRFRRKVNDYDGVGPMEYMKRLRDSMVDERGIPRDIEHNPTSTWCLMDNDVVNDVYHYKTINWRCSMTQQFNFSLESLATELNDDIKLSKSVLRVYLQPIRRLLPANNETVDIEVNITARAIANDSEASGSIHVSSQKLTITSGMEDHWEEWDITKGVKGCWDSISNISTIEFKVNFRKIQCIPGKKKIPLEIVDPATIPLEQAMRRSRHWPLQPFVLVFLDDEEEKKQLYSSLQEVEPEEFVVAFDTNDDEIAKSKRAVVPPCRPSSLQIHFANLGMHHVLAPFSYDAKQCKGDCSKRSLHNNSVNNHGRLLATAHHLYEANRNNITCPPIDPRCVSLTYGYMNLITLKNDGMLESRNYPNMIATSCGCRA